MDTTLFSGHLGAFDALSHLMLSLYNLIKATSKNLPSSGTKWLPIMTYINACLNGSQICISDMYM
jgi:hypothetical protein